ncbi:MAG: hypothetical protein D4R84_15105 [Rhodocyclaceae bacterium]|nr:MAG: hypothetical protein D4R84_15105 [Rhodocyclaceae bacterium]
MNYNPKPAISLPRIALIVAFSCAVALVPAPVLCASSGTRADRGDAAFLSAREAFRSGEQVRLGRQMELLQGHPLLAWADTGTCGCVLIMVTQAGCRTI